jgi:CrcB protein
MSIVFRVLLLGVAGGVGTLLRYGISLLAQRLAGTAFPWGTLAVNVLGCLMFGWIWTLATERRMIGVEARVILLTGFLGGLTTFSSYAFESTDAFRRGSWTAGAINMLLQNMLGLAAVMAGVALGRWGGGDS